MKILVTMPNDNVRKTFFTEEVIVKLNTLGEVIWNDTTEQYTPDQLKELLTDVDICVTGWRTGVLDKYVLESAKNLKIVAHTGGSVFGIVSDYLYEKGIKVVSGNWIFAECTAEGALTYILSALRQIPRYSDNLQKGIWREDRIDLNETLLEKKVGLVGFGLVAKNLARMIKPFNVELKVYDPFVEASVLQEYGATQVSVEELFSWADIVSVHVPKTPETHHMINAKLLSLMHEGALLVNTSRGAIIDEQALGEELQAGRIKAALDVFEAEPLPADSKLRGLRNAFLIPHMAGPTIDRRKDATLAVLSDVKRFFDGDSLKYEIKNEYAKSMTR